MTKDKPKKIAIVGGGFSGLFSAWQLLKKNPNRQMDIHVYESTGRLGGKVQNDMFPGGSEVINAGPEFIDHDHDAMRDLCRDEELQKLGLKLIHAEEQENVEVLLRDGRKMSVQELCSHASPIQSRILDDKEIIRTRGRYNPDRFKHLLTLSLTCYLQELNTMTDKQNNDVSAFEKYKVDPHIIEVIGGIYASENGRGAGCIDAVQFINESSKNAGKILASDCAYRVAGGTEKLIQILEKYLKRKNVHFHYGQKAIAIGKNGMDEISLTFRKKDEKESKPEIFDSAIPAVTAPALGRIKGLESVGLTQESITFLTEAQHTENVKFAVKIRKSVAKKLRNANLFSYEGYQAWQSAPGVMSFLAAGDILKDPVTKKERTEKELMDYCLDRFSATCQEKNKSGEIKTMKASDFFDSRQYVCHRDFKKPCYASPGPGQSERFVRFAETTQKLAGEGICIVGTYIPHVTEQGQAIGFLNCGAESAKRGVEIMSDMWSQQEIRNDGIIVRKRDDSFAARRNADKTNLFSRGITR